MPSRRRPKNRALWSALPRRWGTFIIKDKDGRVVVVDGEGEVVEEVVDFGAGHGGGDGRRAVGDSLLLPVGVLGCKLVELWETW